MDVTNLTTTLETNGFTVSVVTTKEEAKNNVLALVPEGSEVMTMTSVTLEQTGLKDALETSGKFKNVRTELAEKPWAGAVPEWSFASVHAITEQGQLVIASNTGSQLGAAAYGAKHVVFVVGTQKIVKDLDAALARIDAEIVPKESVRARQAYHLPDTWNTYPSKILIINRESVPNRIHIVLVNEPLGF